jgi:hypothetical protein
MRKALILLANNDTSVSLSYFDSFLTQLARSIRELGYPKNGGCYELE